MITSLCSVRVLGSSTFVVLQTEGKVVNLEAAPAAAVKLDAIKASLEQHKPAALFLCQVSQHGLWHELHHRFQATMSTGQTCCPASALTGAAG